MKNDNLPTMQTASHVHTAYSSDELFGGLAGPFGPTGPTGLPGPAGPGSYKDMAALVAREGQVVRHINPYPEVAAPTSKTGVKPAMAIRRIVQVYIVDTNESVPLNQSLIYRGTEKLTDATDQELFFEINIKELLDGYNAERVKIVDKTIKDRTAYLEPVRIRDLKMTVTTVASF